MFAGLALFFKPLSTLGAVIPILGWIVGAGTGLVACLISLALSLSTIAIACFFYRPVLAIILLLLAALSVFLMILKKRPVQVASPPTQCHQATDTFSGSNKIENSIADLSLALPQ